MNFTPPTARTSLADLLRQKGAHGLPLEVRFAALLTIGENRAASFEPVKSLRLWLLHGATVERFVPFRSWLEPTGYDDVRKRLGNSPLTDGEKDVARQLAEGVRV